jgi:hypothetical protein
MQRLIFLALALTLNGCSVSQFKTDNSASAETLRLIKHIAVEHKPPLMLRVTTDQPSVTRQGDILIPAMHFSRETARDVAKYSSGGYAPGLIITLPIVGAGIGVLLASEAVSDSSDQSAIERCNNQWSTYGKDGSQWAEIAFGLEPITQALTNELRHQFAQENLQHLVTPITIASGWTYPDLTAIENSLAPSEPTVILGDVRQKFDWGLFLPARTCGIRLTYDIHLYVIDANPAALYPALSTNMVVTTEVAEPNEIQMLLNDQNATQEWVKKTVSRLAEKIADVYIPKPTKP